MDLLYFTLLLSPFIVGMLWHDKSVQLEQLHEFYAKVLNDEYKPW